MVASPLRLLDWNIPSIQQHYTQHNTALYALSVGLGHSPLDPLQLALVDPWNPKLTALPSMALVLGYPGFWLGEPAVHRDTGILPEQVLHIEQTLVLHETLPAQGKVVGHTRVTGLVDKGVDRGCLIYSERNIHLADDERLLATCRQTHYLRGAGGFGATNFTQPAAASSPPSHAPDHVVELTTRPEQALIYRLNGDANRLHFDPNLAQQSGFKRPILHGMCTMGVVTHALLRARANYETARLHSLTVRMTAPVFPGDTIRTEIWNTGEFRAHALERKVIVIDGHADIQ